MRTYEIDFSYKLPEYGVINLDAADKEEAEELAMKEIRLNFPDVVDIEIDAVREIKIDQLVAKAF